MTERAFLTTALPLFAVHGNGYDAHFGSRPYHRRHTLDAAVAAAYGWPADLTDEQILERLFELNEERAAAQ